MKKLDDIDRQIVGYLLDNGRDRVTDIADSLKFNRVTVAQRIERLVRIGVIKRFTVKLDYEFFGLDVLAFVFISFKKTDDTTQEELAQIISRLEGVEEVHIIAGEFDIIARVRAKNLRELGEKVVNKIRGYSGVETTFSHIVFQTIKE
ncbi:MAG: Lrp/AsnC family transcriptional regulator [Thermoplasmatales archaeon]|jgi:DNA-binding Lrp family transcriptional regulator|nr:Lrp/AsnC family transcriptional regulator [Candidatus Thermoplasmatota archaeon]MCL6003583.1 Lrp/AsnC family transcriptional regulator [Candidatus Thermoplasmatota archaeon]MDA8054772.1 Lrp/AsnC family transcriptional regulator [Thermoplasmatales archaeon]